MLVSGRYKATRLRLASLHRPESEAERRGLGEGANATLKRGATGNCRCSVASCFLTEMGHTRRRPKRLAEKLRQIRYSLGVSRQDMIKRLGVEIPYKNISRYERDRSEPPIELLLAYARSANVSLAQIIDDDEDLGLSLPHG